MMENILAYLLCPITSQRYDVLGLKLSSKLRISEHKWKQNILRFISLPYQNYYSLFQLESGRSSDSDWYLFSADMHLMQKKNKMRYCVAFIASQCFD